MEACTGIAPKPELIEKYGDIRVIHTETPALTLPTFSEGFWRDYAAKYPGSIAESMKPNVENIARLKPPIIPDFGLLVAQRITSELPKNFKTWPHSQVELSAVKSSELDTNKATFEVKVRSNEASWAHGYLMSMVELTMYAPTKEIIMSKMVAVNALYLKNSKKIEDVIKEDVGLLTKEYELAADDITLQLINELKSSGIK